MTGNNSGTLWKKPKRPKTADLQENLSSHSPVELDKDSNISLLQDFIKKNFVDMGMCADFAIHDTDGHNPHAHILTYCPSIKRKRNMAV